MKRKADNFRIELVTAVGHAPISKVHLEGWEQADATWLRNQLEKRWPGQCVTLFLATPPAAAEAAIDLEDRQRNI